jgi:hypothetical protein
MSGTIAKDLFWSSTDFCLQIFNFDLDYLKEVQRSKLLNTKNTSNPQFFWSTARLGILPPNALRTIILLKNLPIHAEQAVLLILLGDPKPFS